MGDVRREPSAKTKYGLYFDAIGRKFPLVDVLDARLYGVDRYLNALINFHPNHRMWREGFYKNLFAFKRSSERVAAQISKMQDRADLVLQVGVLFDAGWNGVKLPRVIYTDYTAFLASKRPWAGRSPFTREELQKWIALERRSLATAVHIFTRSDLVRTSIIKDYGIPPERVSTVGGGVNFSPLPPPVAHEPEDPPTALFIGKEFYRKGGDLLLCAFARARMVAPNARLLFLTEDTIPAGLPTEGVEFVPPTWERKTIARLYEQAHVLVLPSRLETWGDVLLEAMGFGLPCIGVCGQAMEEVIIHQETGIVIPPEDEQALSQALITLFTNPELRTRWGAAARKRVQTEYSWDRVVERTEDPLVNGLKAYHGQLDG
jgi:glycosyltransferase involved in cell wall biosynthesis